MIAGYVQRKDAKPGTVIRLQNGTYALVTEYHSGGNPYFDAYIVGTGEAVGTHVKGDEWVAVIDMNAVEVELQDDLTYPPSDISVTGQSQPYIALVVTPGNRITQFPDIEYRAENLDETPWGWAMRMPPVGALYSEGKAIYRGKVTGKIFRPGDLTIHGKPSESLVGVFWTSDVNQSVENIVKWIESQTDK